ncbi:MAG: class I SAM-dependent methyltransferase [Gammaproteobacteria bacterium]|nr:class I SAM-dependent methyltransferase [Gammaproteobacteria bacterium]
MKNIIKPFSESCEQNKEVILNTIQPLLSSRHNVLEIGSGTGQHAIYFSQAMPHLQWHTSDRYEALSGIQMWLDEFCSDDRLSNVHPPIVLDVAQSNWPALNVDAIFTANTLHIMNWNEVQIFFKHAPKLLNHDGILLIYGPFNYDGKYTSKSNEHFDSWLKSRDSESGIRDFSELEKLATEGGLTFLDDYEMPENNRILCWKKK